MKSPEEDSHGTSETTPPTWRIIGAEAHLTYEPLRKKWWLIELVTLYDLYVWKNIMNIELQK